MSRVLPVLLRFPVFALWFVWQVLTSSGTILHDIATPGSDATPRVVRLPLGSRTDGQATLIATLITLTPGTLTLGIVEGADHRELLVHSMYHHDNDAALRDLRHMEDRMLHALAEEVRR